MKPRYSVLQYSFGGYEILHEIGEKDPEAEYIYLTDNPKLQSSTWKVVFCPEYQGKDPVWSSWHARFHLFDHLSTDVCISMDASTIIRKTLRPLYDKFQEGNYDVCVMPHPCRSLLAHEYAAWVKGRKYPESQGIKCIQFLATLGYDTQKVHGLYQGNFRISRNNKDNDDYMRLSWAFLSLLADDRDHIERVDQNICSAIMNKWFSNWKVLPLSEQVVRSDALTWCYHGTERPKLDAYAPDGKTWNMRGEYDFSKPDMKWVLGKEVQCFYFKEGKLFK